MNTARAALSAMAFFAMNSFRGLAAPQNFYGHYKSGSCKGRDSAYAYYHLTLEERRERRKRERQARRHNRQLVKC